MEVTAWIYAVASSFEKEDELEEDLEDLLTTKLRRLDTCHEEIGLVNMVIMHCWMDISMSTLMMPFGDYSA